MDGQRPQNRSKRSMRGNVAKSGVAGEKFIPAQTGERYLDPGGPGLPRNKKCIQTIDSGLVHGLERVRDGVQHIALRNHDLLMLRGKSPGHGARIFGLRCIPPREK